jgi:hypothetical protein
MRTLVRDDRGAVAAGVAILPMVLTMFFVVLQVSFWYHGRSVATAAAHHALEAARSYESTAADGEAAAREFLDLAGGLESSQLQVRFVDGGDTVEVTIDAEPVSVVPGLNKSITVTLSGPVERIVE